MTRRAPAESTPAGATRAAPSESAPSAPVPARPTMRRLRDAVQECRACELWAPATQAVMGEGAVPAKAMLIGEQPGDREDREGAPFVGPAGRVLDAALADAGIDRRSIYVTNVVKHFRYRSRGKRRIHQRPEAAHIAACKPWLRAELDVVRPEVLVLMGATASAALLGSRVRVTRDRGELLAADLERQLPPGSAPKQVLVTVHPSSLLRAPDRQAREKAYRDFVRDLRVLACAIEGGAAIAESS